MNEIAIQQFLYVYVISDNITRRLVCIVISNLFISTSTTDMILNNNESNFRNLRLNCSYMFGYICV